MRTSLLLFVIVAILCFSMLFFSCESDFDKMIESDIDTSLDEKYEILTDGSDAVCEEDKKALAEFINFSTEESVEALRKFDFYENDGEDILSDLRDIEFEILAEISGKKIYFGVKNATAYLKFDGVEEYIFVDGERAVAVSVLKDERGEVNCLGEEIGLREHFELCNRKLGEYKSIEAFDVSADDIEFSDGEYLLCSEYADKIALPLVSVLALAGGVDIDLSGKENSVAVDDFRASLSYTVDRGRVTGRFFRLEVSEKILDRLGLDSFCLSSDSRPYAKDCEACIKITAERDGERIDVFANIDVCADKFPKIPAEVVSFATERGFDSVRL